MKEQKRYEIDDGWILFAIIVLFLCWCFEVKFRLTDNHYINERIDTARRSIEELEVGASISNVEIKRHEEWLWKLPR